jgi:hypothetical protein
MVIISIKMETLLVRVSHLRKIREFIQVGDIKITGKRNKVFRFQQYDSMLLCEWMYENSTLYMKRKKDIWDQADKVKLRNSQNTSVIKCKSR